MSDQIIRESVAEAAPGRRPLPAWNGTEGRATPASGISRLGLRSGAWPEVVVGVLACLLYLPVAARVLKLGPDAVEYLDIGRRLAAGQGFMLGVKAFHFGGTDVLHNGLAERPPLFPLMIAGLYALGLGHLAIQVVNAAMTGLCVTLVALIGRRLFRRETGLLAAVLTATSPLVLERMIWPMTEAITLLLTLTAVWLAVRVAAASSRMDAQDDSRARDLGAAGLLIGLAYLARPTTLALTVALAAAIVLAVPARRQLVRPMVAYMLGVSFFVVPISVYSVVERGSLSYSGQTYLYAVYKDPEVMELGFTGTPLPSAGEFVRQNPGLVAGAMAETMTSYAYLLFAEWELLLPLAVAWPGVVWALARRRWPRVAIIPLAIAGTNFLVYGLTWSTFQDRYLLLTMLLLFPFAIDGLRQLALDRIGLGSRRWPNLVHVVVALAVAIWIPHLPREYRGEFRYGELPVRTRKDEGLVWTAPPRWVGDNDLPRLVNWISTRTERLDVVAHAQPWPYTFFTERPAVLLPKNLTDRRLEEFIEAYRVDYVLLDSRDRDRRAYIEHLETLEDAGVEKTTLGAYRIFDVRRARAFRT